MESIVEGYYIFNGKLYPVDRSTIDLNNRAFNYGDGLFETIRVVNGKVKLLHAHFERLKMGMEMLSLGPLDMFSASVLQADIEELIKANGIFEGGRIKLVVFRKSGGFYTPQTNRFDYVITANAFAHNIYKLNEKGLTLGLYSDVKKPINSLGNIKTLNALLYILAGVYKKAKKFDEVLIQNDEDFWIESSSSNLFWVKDNVLFTPPLHSACLAGVMRDTILSLAPKAKLKVVEKGATKADLIAADELFLTNAIQGIQWVSAFERKRYFNATAKRLNEALNRIK